MIATLQSLRFVFVMLIFLSHFAYRDIQALDAGGDCGVAFFFLLSGFVLSLGYGRKIYDGTFCYGRFLKRRFLKLYPLHLLCLIFFLVVGKVSLDWSVLLNVLLLQAWIPNPDYYFSCNSVSWFLSCLFFCYILFPFAYKRVSVRWLSLILVGYVIVYLLIPYEKVNAILYVNPLVRFVDFYLGMFLCQVYERRGKLNVPQWTELIIVLFLLASLVLYPYVDAKFRNAPLYWLVLMPLIFVFAQEKGYLSRWLKTRSMLFLGSLSMPLFLTHQMLIGIMLRRLPEMSTPIMLAACIFITLMVSWGIHIIFSRLLR
ncbi:MAG: acyltransferase [Prevotella sp.]|nr:acyltransferase [Prevotella sp.]